jgi:DNA helicase HerA-like ATPase
MDFERLIYDIKRQERDELGAAVERPDARQWAESFAAIEFYRLQRHARFWGDTVDPLFGGICNLSAGLHGVCRNWVFLLNGTPAGIECWFGISHREDVPRAERLGLAGLLMSELREIVGDAASRPNVTLARDDHLFSISGAPTPPIEGARTGPIDKLCRGLAGATWQYVVHADPKPAFDAAQRAKALDLELTRAGLGYQKDSFDVAESTYREAMEALRKRLTEGTILGLWDVDVFLSSPSREVARRGAALLQSALGGPDSVPDPMRALPCSTGGRTTKEPCLLTSRQLAVLTCPPAEEYPGYEIVDHAHFGVQPIRLVADKAARRLQIGDILADGNSTGNTLAMDLDELTAHALIVGVTGSGKTNTAFQILAQLAANDVPFLVIESAKSEYRELLRDARFKKKPRIFTVGNETVAPLRLNPFEVPQGTLVQIHIDFVKQLFEAAFPLEPPMPQVLARGIEEIYKDCGWDLAANRNARAPNNYRGTRLFPTLDDLVVKVQELVAVMDYEARIRGNLTTALINRLDQLRKTGGKGPMFNTRQSLPAEDLFERPCILELESLVSDDEKAFLIGLILIRLYEYHRGSREEERRARRREGSQADAMKPGRLRHVTLIEEAHRLLRNVGTGPSSEGMANPKGQAIEVFSNMLAEIRAYGEGIVMAEQIPTKLVPDAVKNTNLKIVHRLLAEDDRKVVGSTMSLTDEEIRHLTRLQKGQAVVYSEKLLRPVLLKVPPSPVKEEARISDDQLPEGRKTVPTSATQRLNELNAANPRLHEELTKAFAAVYRSLLDTPATLAGFVDTYWPFLNWVARATGPSAAAAADIFAALLDAEISARGRAPGWPFDAMDAVVAHGGKLAYLLAGAASQKGPSKADQAAAAEVWRDLASAVVRLQHVSADKLPYWGCFGCAAPCRYRHDIETRFRPKIEESRRFFESLRDRAAWAELLPRLEQIGRQAFPRARRDTQSNAAYCYLVHQLDGARALIPADQAQEIAKFFWENLHRPAAPQEAPAAPVAAR